VSLAARVIFQNRNEHRKSGEGTEKTGKNDQMRLRIPEVLTLLATSFPLLSFSAVILSSQAIVTSRDVPHAAFFRRQFYSGERS
jgi:hypothetical protein